MNKMGRIIKKPTTFRSLKIILPLIILPPIIHAPLIICPYSFCP